MCFLAVADRRLLLQCSWLSSGRCLHRYASKPDVSLEVTPCLLVTCGRHFAESYCHELQGLAGSLEFKSLKTEAKRFSETSVTTDQNKNDPKLYNLGPNCCQNLKSGISKSFLKYRHWYYRAVVCRILVLRDRVVTIYIYIYIWGPRWHSG